LCDEAVGGDDRCAELLESLPNFDELFERKSTEAVQGILDAFLNGEEGNDEVNKYSSGEKSSSSSVEDAFNELLGS
jgi:hypothetical protein